MATAAKNAEVVMEERVTELSLQHTNELCAIERTLRERHRREMAAVVEAKRRDWALETKVSSPLPWPNKISHR